MIDELRSQKRSVSDGIGQRKAQLAELSSSTYSLDSRSEHLQDTKERVRALKHPFHSLSDE